MFAKFLKQKCEGKGKPLERANEIDLFYRGIERFELAVDDIKEYAHRVEDLEEESIQRRVECFTESYLNIIRKSLFYDYVLDCVGGKERTIPRIYPKTDHALPTEKEKNVNMRDRCILVHYRKPWAIAAQCERVKNGKTLDGEKYYLYRNLGLGYPKHGNHRIISAAMTGYDLIAEEVEIIDDTDLLRELEIRDMRWYEKGKDASLGDVFDYRLALIFVILHNRMRIGSKV